MRKIDPNKTPEDIDALIRLGLMMEKHKDVVTEELDEDGKPMPFLLLQPCSDCM